eukprot:TRINITY_DN3519_c0_g1_i2.p1 TRINITY_DN3519_c0_g1~~TRINITY_DN3519_c0_g1_i2.p1  ORF type:complete len:114 (+),score=27.97 TRINITY_DN3519_c0_g1_i2:142-483(+)
MCIRDRYMGLLLLQKKMNVDFDAGFEDYRRHGVNDGKRHNQKEIKRRDEQTRARRAQSLLQRAPPPIAQELFSPCLDPLRQREAAMRSKREAKAKSLAAVSYTHLTLPTIYSV